MLDWCASEGIDMSSTAPTNDLNAPVVPDPTPSSSPEPAEAPETDAGALDFTLEFYDIHGYNQPEVASW
jgi:hypothetical protein